VVESDDIVIVTVNGIVIRQHASEIRIAGRNTQGVRLIRLDSGDTISDVAAVASEEGESEEPTAPRQKSPTSEEPGETEPPGRAAAEKGEAKGKAGKPKSPGRNAAVKGAQPGKRKKRR
jgi:DNA gyrase/topoisomerase IV subunit A